MSSPSPPFRLSLPLAPFSRSFPPAPFSVSLSPPPLITLARALPLPVNLPDPTKVRFSRLLPSV
ncbi:MAG: hypothetical protein C0484_19980 [Rhodospirillum sp.]|nr:hypothetical protein [Rhodospirillum sp.]